MCMYRMTDLSGFESHLGVLCLAEGGQIPQHHVQVIILLLSQYGVQVTLTTEQTVL